MEYTTTIALITLAIILLTSFFFRYSKLAIQLAFWGCIITGIGYLVDMFVTTFSVINILVVGLWWWNASLYYKDLK